MRHDLIFSPDDGTIRISGCSFIIRNGLASAEAKVGLHEFHRSEFDHQNGYAWQMYQGFELDGASAGLALCFHLKKLTEIHVGVDLPNLKMESGWPTEEAIHQQIRFLQKALGKQLLRSFKHGHEDFPWGTAWARFDLKGFQATAGLRYN